MRTIAVANQKGGVGKTTLTILLVAALADAGERVLVVDLDPQANLTTATGASGAALSVADVLLDARPLVDAVVPGAWGFDVVPSEIALAAKEQHRRLADEHDLARALETVEWYDVVLVDCPPSLGVLTVNALTAADAVLIVSEASTFAIDGVEHLLETASVVRRHHNPRLSVAGVVINLHDQTLETRRRVADARHRLGDLVLDPVVPRRVAFREAITTATPLSRLPADRDGAALAAIIRDLAEEVTGRVR